MLIRREFDGRTLDDGNTIYVRIAHKNILTVNDSGTNVGVMSRSLAEKL